MRDAYANAERGEYSQELTTLRDIERFGLEAITGRRQFYYGELRRMKIAEKIYYGYLARAAAENWAQWATENSTMAKILSNIEKMEE